MAPLPLWRTVASCALVALTLLWSDACARRYTSGLAVSAPRHEIDESSIAAAASQPPDASSSKKAVARAPRTPTVAARPKAAPRADSQAIATTGADFIGPLVPLEGGVTVTNTPAQTPPGVPTSRSLATIVVQTLRRPAAAVPIGAGFAASAFVSVALYRRRHRVTG